MVKKKENHIGKQKQLVSLAEITEVAVGVEMVGYIVIKLGN